MRGLSMLRRFVSDRRGNIAILFGLAFIPVVGAMAVAVDYSLANEGRTQAQAALDTTALMLSKMMPLTQADLDAKGRKIFIANLGKNPLSLNASNIAEALTITSGVGKLPLQLNTEYHIRMAGILSSVMPLDIPIGSRTEVVWGLGKVEVALALDNTGSMGSKGKMTQLIAAAHKLVEIMKNAAQTPGDAKVAIIPFGFQVRVDPGANLAASWLRWDLWEENNGQCSNNNYDTRSDCTGHNKTWTPNDHSTWNGCIADRDKDPDLNYDVDDTGISTTATKFPSVQDPETGRWHTANDCGSLATVMPLNYNWGDENSINPATLHGKINSMNAVGNTNVTIGLDWALQMVSPTGTLPFSQGAPYGTKNLTKYVIILTDGDNTQNRWTNLDGGTKVEDWEETAINDRTSAACANIKARGIKIYSIRVIDGNASLLKDCASDPSMYFEVSDAEQLVSVFNAIGTTIANLHLAK
jgi:Flp pilus assembly protein TadG